MLEANLFDDNLPSTAPLHFATLSVEPDIDLDVPNVEENAEPTPSPELDVPAPRDSLPLGVETIFPNPQLEFVPSELDDEL